jgi:putative ABC transport system substrate-binding protein
VKRREFVKIAGGAAVAWPLAARAQKAMPVIGFLSDLSPGPAAPTVAAFRRGLSETGYAEGQNLTIEYRWAEGRFDRLSGLAADLVERKVDLIATTVGVPAALAAKSATSTIPIVLAVGADPVATGLVASLARPGGNLTGITSFAAELAPKRLELLSELVPQAKVIALLLNPTNPATPPTSESPIEMQEVARAKGVRLAILWAGTEDEIDSAFASLAQLRASALVVGPDPLNISRRDQIVALAARHAVPAIYFRRDFADAGGLISYAPRISEISSLQVGIYAGKVLKGAKPADLPPRRRGDRVERPSCPRKRASRANGLSFGSWIPALRSAPAGTTMRVAWRGLCIALPHAATASRGLNALS